MAIYNLGTARGNIEIDTKDLREADIVLRQSGDALLGVGRTLVGAFAAVVSTAADFETEMDFVRAVTNGTAEQMADLTDTAIELGKKGPFGPIELAKAFTELAKAGATIDQINDGVAEATVNLAAAAQTDLPFTGESLIGILNTFRLGADEAVHAADTLAGAANASSIDLDDLVTTFRYAGPNAAALGISMEELANATAQLGLVNIRGSTAGTSLRRILLQLSPTTERQADAMKALGLITEDGVNQFFDAEGSAKSLAEVFQILQDATRDLTDEQKQKALNDIFGARAIPSALELMARGAAGFEAMDEAISRTTAADVAAERMDNLNGSLMRLKAAIEATFITAGTPFQKMLQGWVDGLRDIVLWFGKLDPKLQSFLLGAIGVVGILSILSGVFLLTIGNMVRALRLIGDLAQAFGLISSIIRGVGASFLGFIFSPVGLVIVAIAALIAIFYLLYTRVEGFRNFINAIPDQIVKAWDKVTEFFSGLGGTLERSWESIKDGVRNFFQGFSFGGIADSFLQAFNNEGITTELENIHGVVERVGNAIGDAYRVVRTQMGKIVKAIVDAVKDIPGQVAGFVGKLPGIFGRAISASFSAFVNFLTELPRLFGYALGFIIGRTIRWGYELLENFVRIHGEIITFIIEWGGRLVSEAISLGARLIPAFVSWLISLPGFFLNAFVEIFTAFVQFGIDLVQGAFNLGADFLNAIVSFISQLPGYFWSFLQEAWNFVTGFIPSFAGSAFDIGTAVVDGIIDLITGLPGLVLDILNQVIDTFTGVISRAYNAAKDFAGGLWDGFKDGLGIKSPSFIEEAMFAMTANVDKSLGILKSQVGTIQSLGSSLPGTVQLPESSMTGILRSGELSSPSAIPAVATGATAPFIVQGPLIGESHLDNQYDTLELVRDTYRTMTNLARAQGRRVPD